MARSSRRQFVLIGPDKGGENAPLGRLLEVREILAGFNTGSDGSPAEGGALERLHGPGMVIEIAVTDPVTQAIAHVNDEPLAWPVLSKLCQTRHWRLMDMESGRVMNW